MRSILGLWRDLREVRRKQGFTITSHKLTIHKEAPDQHQDLKVVFSNSMYVVHNTQGERTTLLNLYSSIFYLLNFAVSGGCLLYPKLFVLYLVLSFLNPKSVSAFSLSCFFYLLNYRCFTWYCLSLLLYYLSFFLGLPLLFSILSLLSRALHVIVSSSS